MSSKVVVSVPTGGLVIVGGTVEGVIVKHDAPSRSPLKQWVLSYTKQAAHSTVASRQLISVQEVRNVHSKRRRTGGNDELVIR